MENSMQKRYGLFTAISMVVGIVIGSGIFFKATKVLANNNGDMGRSLLTVGIVGAIMLICSFVFANLASRYEKVNGVVDYAEAALGRGYAYYVAWFMTLIYYPTITSTLGWVTSQYAAILFGFPVAGMTHYWVGFGILLADGLINAYAPRLAGKLQVSATVIKLIPLILMAVAGTITGLSNGLTVEAFTAASAQIASQGSGLMGAIVAFAFAYEGWIIATSINSELHNAKKNLPLALSLGALIVVVIYMAYFVGLTGSMSTAEMMAAGDMLPEKAFGNLFGPAAGTIVFVFIVISCLGTTNGLMMGCARGAYSLGVRGEGIAPRFFAVWIKRPIWPRIPPGSASSSRCCGTPTGIFSSSTAWAPPSSIGNPMNCPLSPCMPAIFPCLSRSWSIPREASPLCGTSCRWWPSWAAALWCIARLWHTASRHCTTWASLPWSWRSVRWCALPSPGKNQNPNKRNSPAAQQPGASFFC